VERGARTAIHIILRSLGRTKSARSSQKLKPNPQKPLSPLKPKKKKRVSEKSEIQYTSSAVKESGVASFEYLETDGYVKGSALASLVEFPREGINPKPCSSPERI
jgi:hypothetical protein